MTPLPRIMVAPNGARRGPADHPALPVTLAQILDTAVACRAAGAEGLHLHLRDDTGAHLLSAKAYRDALAAFDRRMPGFPVQVTTEAADRYGPAQQRALLADLRPANVSVAPREILADGAVDDSRALLRALTREGAAIQLILYSADDFTLWDQLSLPDAQLIFVLGRYTDDQQSEPRDLDPFLRQIAQRPTPPDWALCAFGRAETACLLHANKAGGKMRIGFENNMLHADGTVAHDNADRVRALVAALATP